MQVRAIQIDRVGGPGVLHEAFVEVGEPGPGEVRVRHHAIGVNFIDCYHRSGLYPVPLPAVLGTEAAGVVEAVGAGVTHVAAGDRVGYASRATGSYAEARVLDATQVVRLPDSIDFERGAAMMLKGFTVAYLLTRTRHELRAGDHVVWHAAAGGVGLIACQWARALGLRLIATAGSAEKCALALAHGAEHAIDYRREDVVARVKEITGGAGVKTVFDSVGKDTWVRSLDCLRPFGLIVSFGNASGPVPPVELGQLMRKGSLYATRPTLATHTATRAQVAELADALFAQVAAGAVTIDAPRTYKLADAARAHADLESRATTGANVLVP
jgi:NADPH2:quinone reductase